MAVTVGLATITLNANGLTAPNQKTYGSRRPALKKCAFPPPHTELQILCGFEFPSPAVSPEVGQP